ncbi:MAG: glycoside-pentoside-hexuronide (GPH):cation symporter [Blautia sp.]
MNKTDMNPNAKLSFLERFAYGIGDYAGNLIYSAISAFLLVYYTNVVGASAAAAASIIAVSKILDGVSDLIMGYIVDHTHSKWGKARPWIARLCIPLAVCTVLMFSVPSSFAGSIQIAYMFLTYNLVSTIFYTGINVPYATMQGLMTRNQYERGLLGNFRNLLATAGTMTINTVVLKMTGFFGGGDSYTQKGWTLTFVVLMIVFVVLNMFMFFTCKERVVEGGGEGKKEDVSFIKGLAGLVKNKYWILLVISIFSMYFMMSTFFGSAVYFTMYNMGNDDYYAMVSNLLSIAQIVTLFITPFLMKITSKRNLMMVGMAIATVGFILSGVTTNYTMICVSSVIKGIGFGFGGATMFGCLQDAITYGEWYNGYGTAGMGNAASSFCMKVGSGIGTAALGWILAAGGFDPNLGSQSASALTSITVAFAWVPVITSVICVICMALFNLDKYYPQVVADLEAGKHRGDK